MLFYFSATGNSRWVAEKMAHALGDKTVSITEALHKSCRFALASDERIGFCFPVHGWRPPRIVADFISRLEISPGRHYCYIVLTAGDNIGMTVQLTEKLLAERGLQVDSAFSLIMPESYVGLRFLHLDTPQRAKEKVREAARQLENIEDLVLDRRAGYYHLVLGRWPKINSNLLGAAFQRWLIDDQKFSVDASKCNGCRLCEKKCPVDNISMDANQHPTWLHTGKCLTCFACYHFCPQRAIDFGNQTCGVGQYHFESSLDDTKK